MKIKRRDSLCCCCYFLSILLDSRSGEAEALELKLELKLGISISNKAAAAAGVEAAVSIAAAAATTIIHNTHTLLISSYQLISSHLTSYHIIDETRDEKQAKQNKPNDQQHTSTSTSSTQRNSN